MGFLHCSQSLVIVCLFLLGACTVLIWMEASFWSPPAPRPGRSCCSCECEYQTIEGLSPWRIDR